MIERIIGIDEVVGLTPTLGSNEIKMKYYFVIDTDEYAGSFERQMCAYVTGQVGECGVGQKIANHARQKLSKHMLEIFDEFVMQEPDDHGCHRPCKIYPTPGFYNNGLGFEYQAGEEDKAIEAYRNSCIEESQRKVHPADQEDNEKRWLKKAENAEQEFGHYPSYQSVAISFYEEPEDNEIEVMKTRAEDWAKACREQYTEELGGDRWDHGFNITGFRIVIERTVTEERAI